jgi:hypothetical protein
LLAQLFVGEKRFFEGDDGVKTFVDGLINQANLESTILWNARPKALVSLFTHLASDAKDSIPFFRRLNEGMVWRAECGTRMLRVIQRRTGFASRVPSISHRALARCQQVYQVATNRFNGFHLFGLESPKLCFAPLTFRQPEDE